MKAEFERNQIYLFVKGKACLKGDKENIAFRGDDSRGINDQIPHMPRKN